MSARREGDWAPNRLTLQLGALLTAGGGRMPVAATSVLFPDGGRRLHRVVGEAMKPLVDDEVAYLADGVWYAVNLADLAAWVADGYQAREDAGVGDRPPRPGDIPEQRQAGHEARLAA